MAVWERHVWEDGRPRWPRSTHAWSASTSPRLRQALGQGKERGRRIGTAHGAHVIGRAAATVTLSHPSARASPLATRPHWPLTHWHCHTCRCRRASAAAASQISGFFLLGDCAVCKQKQGAKIMRFLVLRFRHGLLAFACLVQLLCSIGSE